VTLEEETDQLQAMALDRMEALCHHLLPNGRKEGRRWLAGSARGEPGSSFDVNLGTGVFGDWADGEMRQGGIALWMTVCQVDFKTARAGVAAWLGKPVGQSTSTVANISRPKPPAEVLTYELTKADIGRLGAASRRLACDPLLIGRLCEKRPEWSAEALRGIALEGDLGFEEGGIILFGYCHGIKQRWKDREGERHFRWACGAAHGKCWRQGLLSRSHHTVYLNEGETDAITVVSTGVEIQGETLVLALPGATAYPNPAPFVGKRIIVVPDLDKAGARCAEELQRRFHGIAKSIEIVDLREVTSA
jgi:hypothetical protein